MRNCAAVQSRPFNIAQTLQEALSLHQQGRLREAEKLYARALKAAPTNFDALHLLGLIKAQSGQMGEAHRLMSAALKINPNAPDALVNFANVLHALKRDAEALAHLDKALTLRPGDQEALLYRGNALSALDRPQEALACFDAVLARNPAHGDALLNRGTALARLGRHADALTDFDVILARAPHNVEALYNRGTALLELERPDQALAAFDAALASAPQHAGAWTNRGRALAGAQPARRSGGKLRKGDRHRQEFRRRTFQPGALAPHARALATRICRIRMALEAQRHDRRAPRLSRPALARRISARPAHDPACRPNRVSATAYSSSAMPHCWRARGATVVLEVQPELKALLASVDGVASCHARGEPLPAYDVYCPLGSLPLAFKTEPATIPADIPYLRADDSHLAKWRATIEALPGKRVALAWAGHARHPNDRNRSIAS